MAKKRWTTKLDPISEDDEKQEPSPRSHLSQLESQTKTHNHTQSKQCALCQTYRDLTLTEIRQFAPQHCYSHFHIMNQDFPRRQHLLADLMQRNPTLTVKIYVSINMIKDLLSSSQEFHPSQVTTETLNLIEFLASSDSSSATSIITGQWIGRTINNTLYYPHMLNESYNMFNLNFNKIRSPQEAMQFHPWTITKPMWLEMFSNHISGLTWKEFRLASFNSWITIPVLKDTSGRLFVDSSIIETLASTHNIRLPKELQDLLTINYSEYLPEQEIHIIEKLYKEYLKEFWKPGSAIGPIIPIQTFARGLELLECLLSPKFGLQLFSPITGTLQLLKQSIPFILIAGRIHIPYSVVKLIIPTSQKKILITQQPPKQLFNWLLVHLITAARVAKFGLNINPVISITNLQQEGVTLFWSNIRTQAIFSQLISKLTH